MTDTVGATEVGVDENVGLTMVELEAEAEAAVKIERTAVGKLVDQSVVDAENVEGENVDVATVPVLEKAIGA